MNKKNSKKNLVLFTSIYPQFGKSVKVLKKTTEGKKYRYGVLYKNDPKSEVQRSNLDLYDVTIKCNPDSPKSIITALKPYRDDIVAMSCRGDMNIPIFQKIIPYLPYLKTPTTDSLDWSTNKLKMRQRFMAYDSRITPKYKLVKDATLKTIKELENLIGFPMVVKPIGLSTSLLVNISYHHEELEMTLKKVLRKIKSSHKENNGRAEPRILVEQFIDGDMYSVDAHVGSRGKIEFNPFVQIKTGRNVGFDDFFAYQTITPSNLNKNSIEDAQEVSRKAIRALGLRSTTAHVELLKTEKGWKIIEVGPRMGGFRDEMYKLSYDTNLLLNDILTRIPNKKIILPQKVQGHTAVLKVYPKKEGYITKLKGIKKSQLLRSFHSINIKKKIGDRATHAKHGGKDIFNITFFNKERSKLLADIRRFEQMLEVETQQERLN